MLLSRPPRRWYAYTALAIVIGALAIVYGPFALATATGIWLFALLGPPIWAFLLLIGFVVILRLVPRSRLVLAPAAAAGSVALYALNSAIWSQPGSVALALVSLVALTGLLTLPSVALLATAPRRVLMETDTGEIVILVIGVLGGLFAWLIPILQAMGMV